MHFSVPLAFLLPALAVGSPLPGLPTAADVTQDISKMNSAVLALQSGVQSFTTGTIATGFIGNTVVLTYAVDFHAAAQTAIADANAAKAFTVQETKDVIDTIVSTLESSVAAATQALKDKETMLMQSALGTAVTGTIATLMSDINSFYISVQLKTNTGVGPDELNAGASGFAAMQAALKDAMVAFQGPSLV